MVLAIQVMIIVRATFIVDNNSINFLITGAEKPRHYDKGYD